MEYICQNPKCAHKWTPRIYKDAPPLRCPKCNRKRWNVAPRDASKNRVPLLNAIYDKPIYFQLLSTIATMENRQMYTIKQNMLAEVLEMKQSAVSLYLSHLRHYHFVKNSNRLDVEGIGKALFSFMNACVKGRNVKDRYGTVSQARIEKGDYKTLSKLPRQLRSYYSLEESAEKRRKPSGKSIFSKVTESNNKMHLELLFAYGNMFAKYTISLYKPSDGQTLRNQLDLFWRHYFVANERLISSCLRKGERYAESPKNKIIVGIFTELTFRYYNQGKLWELENGLRELVELESGSEGKL